MSGMVGMAMQAGGGLYAGMEAYKAGSYNAAVAKQEAQTTKVLTDIAIARHKRFAAKLKSSQIASYGASGVVLEGSPILVMADSAAEAQIDEALIRYSGTAREHALYREAKIQKQAGRAAWYGALISAGQSGAKAGGQIYSKYKAGGTGMSLLS